MGLYFHFFLKDNINNYNTQNIYFYFLNSIRLIICFRCAISISSYLGSDNINSKNYINTGLWMFINKLYIIYKNKFYFNYICDKFLLINLINKF